MRPSERVRRRAPARVAALALGTSLACGAASHPSRTAPEPEPAQLGAWLTQEAEADHQRPKLARSFEPRLGRPAFSIARIANPLPRDNPATPDIDESETYFESCPDGEPGPAGPACFPIIPAGRGFYTLSTDIGGARQVVRVGSNQTFGHPQLPTREPNPFFFQWLRPMGSGPLSARLQVDNTSWRNGHTPNIYMGLHFNTPRGGGLFYFGGMDIENEYMHTDRAFTEVHIRATHLGRGPRDDAANARFVVGIVWSSILGGRSYDIEFNLDNVEPRAGSVSPAWSASLPVARNETDPGGAAQYVYLGGQAWGLPPLLSANGFVEVRVPWRHVIQKLIQMGQLSPDSLADRPARPLTFIVGIEQLGRLDNELEVRGLALFDVAP